MFGHADANHARADRRLAPCLRRTVFCAFLWLTGFGLNAAESVALSGRAMGTTWAVKFRQPATPLDPAAVAAQVADRLEQLEQQFSTYRPQSEISRFNATTSTDWFPVSAELARVVLASREVSELTQIGRAHV